MRTFSLVSICAALIVAAACSSTSSDSGGGEIRSEADLQRLFEAIMPDLVEVLTELADSQFAAPKAEGDSSVDCPGGGELNVNINTGFTTLVECSVGGVTLSSTLAISVQPIGPSSYEAYFFNGLVTVSGSYTGTFEVVDAIIQWSVPATVANIVWSVTVRIGEQYFFASSEDSGGGEGGGGGNGMEQCADGDFVLNAGTGTECTVITKEVCFHSESNLGGCPVYNYRIPPSTDFSEFMDIFYGGEAFGCPDNVLAEFVQPDGSSWLLFGTPAGLPPKVIPEAPQLVVTNGSYSYNDVDNNFANGSFEFYWPSQPAPMSVYCP